MALLYLSQRRELELLRTRAQNLQLGVAPSISDQESESSNQIPDTDPQFTKTRSSHYRARNRQRLPPPPSGPLPQPVSNRIQFVH